MARISIRKLYEAYINEADGEKTIPGSAAARTRQATFGSGNAKIDLRKFVGSPGLKKLLNPTPELATSIGRFSNMPGHDEILSSMEDAITNKGGMWDVPKEDVDDIQTFFEVLKNNVKPGREGDDVRRFADEMLALDVIKTYSTKAGHEAQLAADRKRPTSYDQTVPR